MTSTASVGRSAERRFYMGMSLAMLATVFVGFSRTFFLKPWFPEAASMAPPEPFFFGAHGLSFVAWMLLLVVQPLFVTNRRVDLHRRLGWFGAALAVVMVVVGVLGALMAARRPGGFIGVPAPPLEFLAIPLADLTLFAVFVAMAIAVRRNTQSHKRLMLLGTIGLMDAAVVRFPFADMTTAIAGRWFSMTDLGVDLFLVPLVLWDLASRGRLHRVTLIGGLTIIASQPLRIALSGTDAWRAFATWAVGLLG